MKKLHGEIKALIPHDGVTVNEAYDIMAALMTNYLDIMTALSRDNEAMTPELLLMADKMYQCMKSAATGEDRLVKTI